MKQIEPLVVSDNVYMFVNNSSTQYPVSSVEFTRFVTHNDNYTLCYDIHTRLSVSYELTDTYNLLRNNLNNIDFIEIFSDSGSLIRFYVRCKFDVKDSDIGICTAEINSAYYDFGGSVYERALTNMIAPDRDGVWMPPSRYMRIPTIKNNK